MKIAVALAAAALLVSSTGAAVAAPVRPHPGDSIRVAGGPGDCTLGFLFRGSDGADYMSTAGHCLLGATTARKTWAAGRGPVVSTSEAAIGRLVFAENQLSAETGDYYDFALVRLDKGVHGSPEIREYGTPTGVNDERGQDPAVLRAYGHGVAVAAVQPARQVLAPNTRHADHVYAHGPLIMGDSGGPVIDQRGRAVGTVLGAGAGSVGVGIGAPRLTHDGALNIIGRLAPVLQHASQSLRLRLVLRTS